MLAALQKDQRLLRECTLSVLSPLASKVRCPPKKKRLPKEAHQVLRQVSYRQETYRAVPITYEILAAPTRGFSLCPAEARVGRGCLRFLPLWQ
jgi:hypothetical protein